MAKGWALSTGNLPRGGLPRVTILMTSAVDCGCKALTTNRAGESQKMVLEISDLESRGIVLSM